VKNVRQSIKMAEWLNVERVTSVKHRKSIANFSTKTQRSMFQSGSGKAGFLQDFQLEGYNRMTEGAGQTGTAEPGACSWGVTSLLGGLTPQWGGLKNP
jgi:hypothetical protein